MLGFCVQPRLGFLHHLSSTRPLWKRNGSQAQLLRGSTLPAGSRDWAGESGSNPALLTP